MTAANVLARRSRPTTKSYRAAVKAIVLRIQGAEGLNDAELAERLGCSSGTVKNARTEATNLDGVTLANMLFEFGAQTLDPVMALGDAKGVPIDAECSTDPAHGRQTATALSRLMAKLNEALEDDNEVTDAELLAMAPEIAVVGQKLDAKRERLRRLCLKDAA